MAAALYRDDDCTEDDDGDLGCISDYYDCTEPEDDDDGGLSCTSDYDDCAEEEEDDDDGFGCSDDDGECPEGNESFDDDDRVDSSREPADQEEKATTRKAYVVETEDDLRRRQEAAMAEISELLFVPQGYAAALLRFCQWDTERLKDVWFSDDQRVRDAVGLPAADTDGGESVLLLPSVFSDRDITCGICFERYGPGETRSAGCAAHFFCDECWRGYVRAAVGDGPRCLSLRCPAPRCSARVVRELVDAVADAADAARYATFELRSFVEEGKGAKDGTVRWCPGPGCSRAVRSLPDQQPPHDVACACRHGFCFRCGEEAHRPTSCATARAWVEKNSSDGETANWVLVNTKHCPKCRRAIEKNHGCMHMTCGAPCYHEFCWLCLGAWGPHGGQFYRCNRYEEQLKQPGGGGDDAAIEHAKASLERYLHYYERWAAFGDAGKKARADLERLEAGGGLDEFAAAVGVPSAYLDFLVEAYEQVVECRRVLRWTYAYVYYLDPERDGAKREFVEYIQGEAESALEKLHGCAEKERQELVDEAATGQCSYVQEKYEAYKQKLASLSLVMRNHFNNLVESFEAGLDEVLGGSSSPCPVCSKMHNFC